MNRKKFIIEIGMGVDQHGQDPTNSACKAVKDSMARSCLTGLLEIARLEDINDMEVEVLIASPFPERVDKEKVLASVPFGRKLITVVQGGMVARSIYQPELGDSSDESIISNAAVTVYIDMDKVLAAWSRSRL